MAKFLISILASSKMSEVWKTFAQIEKEIKPKKAELEISTTGIGGAIWSNTAPRENLSKPPFVLVLRDWDDMSDMTPEERLVKYPKIK